MKIFKSGELIKASDINSNFAKAIKTDLSNCPVIPCNKGGTGRTDCSIAYADKAGIAEIAEVATIAKGLDLDVTSGTGSSGLINFNTLTTLRISGMSAYAPDYGSKWFWMFTVLREKNPGDWTFQTYVESGIANAGALCGSATNNGGFFNAHISWSMAIAII